MPTFFAYGSLMWERSLPYVVAKTPAVLHKFERSLCLYSWTYRGTRERPGLILGLKPSAEGSYCAGCALHVDEHDEAAAIDYFDKRELINGVYKRRLVTLAAADQQTIPAYAYIADPAHEQYCGDSLSLHDAARLVATGIGTRGTALDYLDNTCTALEQAGVAAPNLTLVLEAAKKLKA